jgi:hypothetical protein
MYSCTTGKPTYPITTTISLPMPQVPVDPGSRPSPHPAPPCPAMSTPAQQAAIASHPDAAGGEGTPDMTATGLLPHLTGQVRGWCGWVGGRRGRRERGQGLVGPAGHRMMGGQVVLLYDIV